MNQGQNKPKHTCIIIISETNSFLSPDMPKLYFSVDLRNAFNKMACLLKNAKYKSTYLLLLIFIYTNTEKNYWNETRQMLAVVSLVVGGLYYILHIMSGYYFYNHKNKWYFWRLKYNYVNKVIHLCKNIGSKAENSKDALWNDHENLKFIP